MLNKSKLTKTKVYLYCIIAVICSLIYIGGAVLTFFVSPYLLRNHMVKESTYWGVLGIFILGSPFLIAVLYAIWKSKRCYDIFGNYIGDR